MDWTIGILVFMGLWVAGADVRRGLEEVASALREKRP